MNQRRFYFTTRDLMMMASLAAVGGVVSTYVNAVGDIFQSVLGFAGTTQWAAGLHVLWLILAVGLTRKQGSATITGIIKGVVELLTGNTHGLLVVLVDVVAGLLVDLGYLPFRKKESITASCFAGGLASASNVFVFQLFASIPTDSVAYWAVFLIAGVAFLSGVLFAGLLGRGLLNTLRHAGVVKDAQPVLADRRIYPIFMAVAILLTTGLAFYLMDTLRGPETVHIGGAVDFPFNYPTLNGDSGVDSAESTIQDMTVDYNGVPVRDLITRAQVLPGSSLVLIRATDGYAFFIGLDEVQNNDALLLSPQGEGDDVSFNIVGAINNKAWVRGVEALVVIGATTVEVSGTLDKPMEYNPDDWQFDMDSIRLDLGDGDKKVQGVPLGLVITAMKPQANSQSVVIYSSDQRLSLSLGEILEDDDLRLFTVIHQDSITFAMARMDGSVLLPDVIRIEVE